MEEEKIVTNEQVVEALKNIEDLKTKMDFSKLLDIFDKKITELEIEQGIRDKDGNLIKKEEK